jgi:hypothetical protein
MEHISLKQLKIYPENTIFNIKAKNFTTGDLKMSKNINIETFIKNIRYYSYLNTQGYNIFLNSFSQQGGGVAILLDDITLTTIGKLKNDGIEPAYWLETSPNNFQAILFMQNIDNISLISKELVKKYSGDPASSDIGHFYRLAGFTNRKTKYCVDGLYPFVKLFNGFNSNNIISNNNIIITEILKKINTAESAAKLPIQEKIYTTPHPQGEKENCYKYIFKIYKNTSINDDISGIDFKAAIYSLKKNFNIDDIKFAIKEFSPNILTRKKNHLEDYIDRTVRNAKNYI